MRGVWKHYNNTSLYFMCRQMITHALTLNDIELHKNGSVLAVSPSTRDALNEYWVPLVPQLVDHIIAFGFCVIIVSEDKLGRKFPQLCTPYFYDITVVVENNIRTYEIESQDLDVSNMLVYDHFGFSPVIHPDGGSLTSLAWKIQPKLNFLKSVRDACSIMEANKSRPHFFTEIVESSRERQEGIDYDYFAEADASEIREDMQFSRNRSNVAILEQQKDLYNNLMGRGDKVERLDDIVQLPSGQKIVDTPQNTGRQDITQLHKVLQEEVCSTLGVPRALLIADSQYKSSTEGVNQLFHNTVRWWRTAVESILTDLHTKIYLNNGKAWKLPKNFYTLKNKRQVQVKLPAVLGTNLDVESLNMMYAAGIIDWDAYSTLMMQKMDLPDHMRNKAPPTPWSGSDSDSSSSSSSSSAHVDSSDVLPGSHKRKRTTPAR